MHLSADFKDGLLWVKLEGELDHHAAAGALSELSEKIDTYLPRDLILDMKNLKFMDSSGIAFILKAYRRIAVLEGRLRVENVQPQPLRVLDASGIERMINISPAM